MILSWYLENFGNKTINNMMIKNIVLEDKKLAETNSTITSINLPL